MVFKFSEKNKENSKKKGNIEYIGVSFGSYQTTVSTTSGFKKTIPTMVGWAKDFIALKFLGKEAAIGCDAFDKRLSLNIYQPLSAGILNNNSKNKEAADAFIDNILEQVKKTGSSSKIHMAIGITSKATATNKKELIDLLSNKVDRISVVSQPFAVAYGLDMLNNALLIDIGAETIDLCLLYGTFPDERNQITIDSGSASIEKLLISLLKRKHENAFISDNIARGVKENFGFIGEPSEKVITQIPVSGKLEDIDMTAELREASESIIPQIIESVKYLLAILDSDYQRETRKNIYIAGAGSQIKGIAENIEKRLQQELGSTKVTAIKDPVATSADGLLKLAMEMPEEFWNDTSTSSESETVSADSK